MTEIMPIDSFCHEPVSALRSERSVEERLSRCSGDRAAGIICR